MLFIVSQYVQLGQTPLMAARSYGFQECVELLIDAGANDVELGMFCACVCHSECVL